MLRKSLIFLSHRLSRDVWLGVLLFAPACSETDSSLRQNSGAEQTTTDNTTPWVHETPALDRQLHLEKLGIHRWHQQGQHGQGVKIAILDSGFRSYRQYLGKGLPPKVKVRSFRRDQNLEARDSQHGILCAEVVHALAPQAELLLANWEPENPQAFLDAVGWAKAEGAKIISCSLIMPSWSDGEGGGAVHHRLQSVLGNGRSRHDMLCCASAGNTAQRHWCGAFFPDNEGWHRWHGDATVNGLTPWGSERVAVELYGHSRSEYELYVFHEKTGELVGKAVLRVDATWKCGRAVIRFEPEADARYDVGVRCTGTHSVEKAGSFHLVVLGGSLTHTTSSGSIPFPGDGAEVISVGAVNASGERLAYSSCGPNSLFPKPDFVAPVPFPSLCRDRPFAGTSAAAPQAAALAALLWSRHPDWAPVQIIQALRASALDLGPPGHDYETGFGLIQLQR